MHVQYDRYRIEYRTFMLYPLELAGDILQASSLLFPAAQTMCKPCEHIIENIIAIIIVIMLFPLAIVIISGTY